MHSSGDEDGSLFPLPLVPFRSSKAYYMRAILISTTNLPFDLILSPPILLSFLVLTTLNCFRLFGLFLNFCPRICLVPSLVAVRWNMSYKLSILCKHEPSAPLLIVLSLRVLKAINSISRTFFWL
jgi:hypothetical protein